MTNAASPLTELVGYELTRSPVKAARLGLDVPGPLLPDMSEAALAGYEREDQAWLARLSRYQPGPGEAIDRELAISGLRGRAVLAEWQLWRRSPELYTTGVLGAIEAMSGRPAREVAATLEQAPELLGQGRRNLDPELAHPRLLRRAGAQARAGAARCRTALTCEAAEAAATAFDDFAAHLAALAEKAHGTGPIGEDRYNTLLRTSAGSQYDAAAIHALGLCEIGLLRGRIAALRAAHPELAAAPAARPAGSVAELIGWHEAELGRARAFCVEHEVLTLPDDEECTVQETPRHRAVMLPVASYSPPPLLADGRGIPGAFLIPSGINQRPAAIATTTIHETYPGHHAHYARMAATVRRHPLRGLFTSAFHLEGWGVYAERYADANGYFSRPDQAQAHLTSLLVRAVRAAVEPALHSGDMTIGQATAFLEQNLRLSGDLAEAEIDRYLAYPTQAAAYLAGAAEISDILERTSLTRDCLTACGALPLNLLRSMIVDTQALPTPAAHPRTAQRGSSPISRPPGPLPATPAMPEPTVEGCSAWTMIVASSDQLLVTSGHDHENAAGEAPAEQRRRAVGTRVHDPSRARVAVTAVSVMSVMSPPSSTVVAISSRRPPISMIASCRDGGAIPAAFSSGVLARPWMSTMNASIHSRCS